tara:strand:- start:425 stop:658 length:234 start_codon:yes stop_codon:yes gene_type:complete
MNQVEEEQLKMEIAHIFESGANEIRILEMVKSFNNRPKQENNLLIPEVVSSLPSECVENWQSNYYCSLSGNCQKCEK